MSTYSDSDRMREVVSIRADYVARVVTRRVEIREGDFTDDEVTHWENQAFEMWRNKHPALSELLPSHLPQDVTA